MPVNFQTLYNGVLTTVADTALYTATGVSAYIQTIRLINTSASSVAVNLKVDDGTNKVRLIPEDFSLGAGESILLTNISLSEDGSIVGDCDTASAVSCYIGGTEKVPYSSSSSETIDETSVLIDYQVW